MPDTQYFEKVLAPTLKPLEGGYSNDPKDPGGETIWGITVAVARKEGYTGAMKDMTYAQALTIYKSQYYLRAGLHLIVPLSKSLTDILFDTGVNMGVGVAGKFLQRALNFFTGDAINVDGHVGSITVQSLTKFLQERGEDGNKNLVRVVNGLKSTHYVELVEGNPTLRKYAYGWIDKRITDEEFAV